MPHTELNETSTTEVKTPHRKRLGLLLWLAGMVGVGSLLPVLPSLLSNLSTADLPVSVWVLQAATLAQTGVLMAVAVFVGVFLAPQVKLSAPAAEAAVSRRSVIDALRPQILWGIGGGLVGGVVLFVFTLILIPHLPEEFVAVTRKLSLPLLTRLLYGGISEEVLIRWGLMTFLVWLPYRTIQKGEGTVWTGYYVVAIVISAIIFGLGHLPLAGVLFPTVTAPLVAYVIIGNALFGVVAGYLYWKRGLESAIIAHMVLHVVMLTAERLAS